MNHIKFILVLSISFLGAIYSVIPSTTYRDIANYLAFKAGSNPSENDKEVILQAYRAIPTKEQAEEAENVVKKATGLKVLPKPYSLLSQDQIKTETTEILTESETKTPGVNGFRVFIERQGLSVVPSKRAAALSTKK